MNPINAFRRSIQFKLVALILLVALVSIAALTILNVLETRSNARERAISDLSSDAAAQADVLETSLRETCEDIVVLSRLPAVEGMQSAAASADQVDPATGNSYEVWRERLGESFLAMGSKTFYDQVRLLDANGVEVVRVNRTAGGPALVADADLQDKSTSDYFTRTREISIGQIYMSPLNLNREGSQLEEPYKPVVRLLSRHWNGRPRP